MSKKLWGHSKDFRGAGVERPSNVIHDFSAMHISSWCSTTPIPVPSPPHSLCLGRVVGGSGPGTCGPVPLFPPTPAPHLPPGGAVARGWKASKAQPFLSCGSENNWFGCVILGESLPWPLSSFSTVTGVHPPPPGDNILTRIQLIHVPAPFKRTVLKNG